jgi:hypothetical protein
VHTSSVYDDVIDVLDKRSIPLCPVMSSRQSSYTKATSDSLPLIPLYECCAHPTHHAVHSCPCVRTYSQSWEYVFLLMYFGNPSPYNHVLSHLLPHTYVTALTGWSDVPSSLSTVNDSSLEQGAIACNGAALCWVDEELCYKLTVGRQPMINLELVSTLTFGAACCLGS